MKNNNNFIVCGCRDIAVALTILLCSTAALEAGSGFFGTGVVINNKGTVTLYEATLLGDSRHAPVGASPTLNSTGFDGQFLGIFDPMMGDVLQLLGGEALTFKNGSDNISGVKIYHSIDTGGFDAGESLIFNEDNVNGTGGDQRWYAEGGAVDLHTLGVGTHTLSVYFDSPYTNTGGSGTHVENNGGSDFTATFSVVPEIAQSLQLLLITLIAGGMTTTRRLIERRR